MTARKILFISSIPTHPVDAGNRARILGLTRSARALGHEVHFAYLRTWPWEGLDLDAMRSEFGADRVHLFVAEAPAFRGGRMAFHRRVIRKLGFKRGFDYALDDWYDSASTPQLAELQARIGFDVAMVEYVFASPAFEAFGPDCLRILDTHDIFADRSAKRTGDGKRLSWYSTSLAEEEAGFRRADLVLAIQETEEASIRARLGAAPPVVTTVSHIIGETDPVDAPYCHAASFFSAGNEANQSALRYFNSEIAPLIRARLPDFTLRIGGSICDILQPAPGIELIGRVDNASEILGRAPIAINPVQVGTGINIKLLDALGAGIPTVTSQSGARGLPAEHRGGVRIVGDSDAQGFASAVVELLTDRAAWQAARDAATAAALAWNRKQLSHLEAALSAQPMEGGDA